MNGWDEALKARAQREDCPLPQGFEERIQKELDQLPAQTRQQKRPLRRVNRPKLCGQHKKASM